MGEVRIYTYTMPLPDLLYFTIEPGHTPSNLRLCIEHNSLASDSTVFTLQSDPSILLAEAVRLGRHARLLDIIIDITAPQSPALDASLSAVADIIHQLEHVVAVSINEYALHCYTAIPVVPSLVVSPIRFIHHMYVANAVSVYPIHSTIADLVYKLSSVATHLSFVHGSDKFNPPTLISPSVVSISIQVPDTIDISASDMQQLLSSYPSLKFFRIFTQLGKNMGRLITQPGTSHHTLTYLADIYSTLLFLPGIQSRFPSLRPPRRPSRSFSDLIVSELRFSPLTVDLESWNHDLRARTGTRLAAFLLAVVRTLSTDPDVVMCVLRHLTISDTPLLVLRYFFF